jgi:hypothetical protein
LTGPAVSQNDSVVCPAPGLNTGPPPLIIPLHNRCQQF